MKPYSPSLANRIAHHLSLGVNFAQTCAVVGITPETLRVWREEKPELGALIRQAQADAVASRLRIIQAAARHDRRAAAWWLEHGLPGKPGTLRQGQNE